MLPFHGFWPVPSLNQCTFSTVSSVSGAQFDTYAADIVEVLNLHLKPGIFTMIWNILKETQNRSNENDYCY